MFRKILLCTDGSERALHAARVAAGLAKAHGAVLVTLHVGQAPAAPAPFPGAPCLAEPLVDQYVRDLHHAVFDRTVPVINAEGVYTETRESAGEPVYEILRAAEAVDADVIVIGTRGLSPANAQALGSVSYGVAHSAPCPVLLVR